MKLTEITLSYPELPAGLAGARIVHLTDLHTQDFGTRESCIAGVLRDGCDLFVCTGDTCMELCLPNPLCLRRDPRTPFPPGFSWRGYRRPPVASKVIAVVRKLLEAYTGAVPPIFIRGNHDSVEFCTSLAELDIFLLENETRQVAIGSGEPISVCAPAGGWRHQVDLPAALLDVDPACFTLALCHFPEMSEALAAAGVELTLAGHTHGGQICLPGGFPLMTHSRTGRVYASGLTRMGRGYAYTGRGAGCSAIPLRLFCPPEITRITLQRAADSPRVAVQSLR